MKKQILIKHFVRKFSRNSIVLIFLLFSLFGCSTFQSHQTYDISPFATSMIAIAGDIQYSLLQIQLIAVRKYVNGPAVENFQIHKNKLRKLIQGVIAYSIQIVTIAESNNSGTEKAEALANYLEQLKKPSLEKPIPPLDITVEQLDSIIVKVRSQKNFLDALGAAQPLIDEVARIARQLTDDTKLALDDAYYEVLDAWEREYSPTLTVMEWIKEDELNSITALYYEAQFVKGNESYLDSVYKYDPLSKRLFPDKTNLTREELLEIADRIIYKLEKTKEIKNLFHSDIVEYEEGLLELDNARTAFNEALRKAGIAMLMWSRAHLQLSKGITEPAEIDIMNLMMGAASKVVPGL